MAYCREEIKTECVQQQSTETIRNAKMASVAEIASDVDTVHSMGLTRDLGIRTQASQILVGDHDQLSYEPHTWGEARKILQDSLLSLRNLKISQ